MDQYDPTDAISDNISNSSLPQYSPRSPLSETNDSDSQQSFEDISSSDFNAFSDFDEQSDTCSYKYSPDRRYLSTPPVSRTPQVSPVYRPSTPQYYHYFSKEIDYEASIISISSEESDQSPIIIEDSDSNPTNSISSEELVFAACDSTTKN